jgi:hypothetical protein
MGNWIAAYQLADVNREELLRRAESHRRLVSSKRFQELPAMLKSLLIILS